MSNSNNKSFLEKLAEGFAVFFLVIAFLSIIWYLISEVIDMFRYGRWDKILKVSIFILVIWLFLKWAQKQEAERVKTSDYQEDTRSGAEIWEENSKNY